MTERDKALNAIADALRDLADAEEGSNDEPELRDLSVRVWMLTEEGRAEVAADMKDWTTTDQKGA